MTRRRRALLGLLIATLVIVPAGWAVWRAITKPKPVRAYERVRLGMTLAEVTEAVGLPPGLYAAPIGNTYFSYELVSQAGFPYASLPSIHDEQAEIGLSVERWFWDEGMLWVAFDKAGKSVGCYLLYHVPPWSRPSFLDRVRAFIGL